MILISIKTLDNRVLASAESCIEGRWSWMQDVVAEQFDCDADDVAGCDSEDEFDLITVRGEPVARVVKSYR